MYLVSASARHIIYRLLNANFTAMAYEKQNKKTFNRSHLCYIYRLIKHFKLLIISMIEKSEHLELLNNIKKRFFSF